MLSGVKFVVIILLWLPHSLNARPRFVKGKTGSHLHFTNIGDITSQDLVQLADSTTPDSNVLNSEQLEDPYRNNINNNIEAETEEYSKTVPNSDTPYLASPTDQEEKFVNLLKKQYKGTFPEYGKETKSDYSKNQELEDNLAVQPETVYFGHSDKYQDNSKKNNDFLIPDEGELDNPSATFDDDPNILSSLEGKLASTTTSPHGHSNADFIRENFLDKITSTTTRPSHAKVRQPTTQSLEDIVSEYNQFVDNSANDEHVGNEIPVTTEDYDGHKSFSEKNDGGNGSIDDNIVSEKAGHENKHVTDRVTDHMTDSMDEHVTDQANDAMEGHVTDDVNDHVTDDMNEEMGGHMDDHVTYIKENHAKEELKKLKEEEALWDEDEKLRQQLSQIKENKQKTLVMTKKKQKSKQEDQSEVKDHSKEKHHSEVKDHSKEKDQSEGILKDFDELKKHIAKTSQKHDKSKAKINVEKVKTNTAHQNSKPGTIEKARKHVKYVHADESQVAGDAILDFLDKLLEKDPKQLKHDVLAMTKEMQKEGNPSSGAPEKSTTVGDDETASNSDSTTITLEKPQVATESPKTRKIQDKVDNWISQLENNIDDVKQEKDMEGINKKNEKQEEMIDQINGLNEDYDDVEFDQFHEGAQEIRPNHKSMSAEQQKSDKSQKAKEEKKGDDFDYEEFKEEALKMHNEYRRRHNAVAFTWSDSLAKKANIIASKLLDATRGNFKRELEKKGENIAILAYSTKNIAKRAIEKWYTEITKFSFTSPSIKPETRGFTQIIWKQSKEIGMGFVHTEDKKKTLVVALYSPSGNDKNKMRENLNTVHDDPYADIKRNALTRKG